jgi:hypothetical protein
MRKLTDLIIALAWLLFAAVLLTSCKAVQKYKASPAFARDCADRYPVKSDTVLRPGTVRLDTITHTVTIDCDTVRLTTVQTIAGPVQVRTVTKACPPCVQGLRVDTLIVTKENTARVAALQADVAALTAERGNLRAQRNKARKQRNWLVVIVAGAVVWSFRHRIIGMLTK